MNIDFANPEFLWALLLLPVLALLRSAAGKNAAVSFSSVAVVGEAAKKSRAKAGTVRFLLTLISLALLIVALARPRQGQGYVEREESGIDIMLTIDLSGSMAGLDLTEDPDRPMTRIDAVKKLQKAGGATEDDLKKFEKEIQTITDKSIAEVNTMLENKEADLKKV